MKLYIKATGEYARTQAEAGKGWKQVDVPTDARGLVAYLNSLGEPPVTLAQAVTEALALADEVRGAPEPVQVPAIQEFGHKVDGMGRICTDYSKPLQPRQETVGRFKLRMGDEADQFLEWVLEAPMFAVSKVFGACMERFDRAVKAAA